MRSLWHLASYINGRAFKPEEFSDTGIPVIRIRQLLDPSAEVNRFAGPVEKKHIIDSGDLIFSWSGSLAVRVWNRGNAALNQHLFKVVPAVGVNKDWLRWRLESLISHFQGLMHGSAMTHITLDMLKETKIQVPSLAEQRRIADFLDIETGRIQSILDARIRQRNAIAERELSRVAFELSGADENGERKPSDWPWFDSIPAHWKSAPIYCCYDVQLGKMLNQERATSGRQMPYLRNANVGWYVINSQDLSTMSFEPSERRRYGVRYGDLLVCEGGAGVAESAIWKRNDFEIYYQKSLHRVRERSGLPVEWLMHWLRLTKHVGLFEASGNISTIPHLTGEQLRSMRIPIPPDARQRVKRLEVAIEKMRSADRQLASANDLLVERRQALITAAVTGQFDVTTAQSRVD